MKKFWEKIQEQAAGAVVSGAVLVFTFLFYKAVPATVRGILFSKVNDVLHLLPPATYVFLLLIIILPLGWWGWRNH